MNDIEDDIARWYIIHAYSGHEERVKKNLEQRIETLDIKDKILNVVVPTEDEIEIKSGVRKTISKKVVSGSDVDVINNQMISVTYARDIAIAVKDLLEKNILFNSKKNTPLVFHYTNNGYTNWYDLAVFISKELGEKGGKIGIVRPISSSEWVSKAIRPADSRLCLDYHLLDSLNIKVFDWHERVSQVLHELYQSEGKKND